MSTVYDVDQNKLIEALAAELRKEDAIEAPAWAAFAKTGMHKERVPEDAQWWHTRVAAILRRIYVHPQGVSRMRNVYGGRKNRGYKPEKFVRGSGSIARKSLQQLEKAGLVKKGDKGREITPKGQKLVDNTVHAISAKASPKKK